MIKFSLLFFIGLLSTSLALAGGKSCAVVFNEDSQSSVDRMIRNLAELRMNIDLAKSQNLDTIVTTAIISDYQKKEMELVNILESNKIMTRPELVEKIKQEILVLQKEHRFEVENQKRSEDEEALRRQEHQKKIAEIVTIDGYHMVFHPIKEGTFKMGHPGQPVDFTIEKPFAMMATPTTQIMWKTVVELIQSRLDKSYDLKADPSNFKGDTHPVEKVTYIQVQLWLKGLNKLSKAGEPALAELIPGHKSGDVYRLPTEAEWEYVVRGLGKYKELYHFGQTSGTLKEYAWFHENSDHKTHPVAQKRPVKVDEKEFYDMYGNVEELVERLSPQPDSINRVGLRGGNFRSSATRLTSHYQDGFNVEYYDESVGFRLVREIHD